MRPCWPQWSTRLPALWNWPRADIPGLLVHSRGTSQWLEAVGRGVGAPQPGSQTVVRTAMEPGDALVVYTDGVVNSTRDMVEGLSVLRASATALRNRPTAGWARASWTRCCPAETPNPMRPCW